MHKLQQLSSKMKEAEQEEQEEQAPLSTMA
jgi:hypothetical protein